MGEILKRRLVMSRFQGPHHEATLNLLLASAHLRNVMERTFAEADLTMGQYNVLRILNGAHPQGYARCEIARRMIERAPDLTRMVDRLIDRGFVERRKCVDDARRSMTFITARGRQLLAKLAPDIESEARSLRDTLSVAEARELSRICEKVYVASLAPAVADEDA